MEGKKVSYPFSRPPTSMPRYHCIAGMGFSKEYNKNNLFSSKMIFVSDFIFFSLSFFQSLNPFPQVQSNGPNDFYFSPFLTTILRIRIARFFCEPFVGIREVGFEIVRPLKKWEKEKAENWPELSVLWTLHEKRSVLLSKGAIIQTFFPFKANLLTFSFGACPPPPQKNNKPWTKNNHAFI